MRTKYISLIMIFSLQSCKASKSQIIDEYLAATLASRSMANMQETFSRKLPIAMPNSIRQRLTAFSKRVWDFSAYTEALQMEEIPLNVLNNLSSAIAFYNTPLGKSVNKSLLHFYENEHSLISSKKLSDFPSKRIEIYQARFLSPENIAYTKRINRDLNVRMMKIFWIVSHPGQEPNESDILAKTRQIIDADEVRLSEYVKHKKGPDSSILRSLLKTMLLSDEEFESYIRYCESESHKELEKFLLDFDHRQTISRMDRYMKSL